MSARLIALALLVSLAACQSGRKNSSTAQITDPNTVFAQGGAQTSSNSGNTNGHSSRRGRGASGAAVPGTDSQ